MATIFKKLKKFLKRKRAVSTLPTVAKKNRKTKTQAELEELKKTFEALWPKIGKAIELSSQVSDLKTNNRFLEVKLADLTLRVQEIDSKLYPKS